MAHTLGSRCSLQPGKICLARSLRAQKNKVEYLGISIGYFEARGAPGHPSTNSTVAISQAIIATVFLIVAGRGDAAEGTFVPKAMSWAYLYSEHPHDLPNPADTAMISVPGSLVSYTWNESTNSSHAVDWFPLEHPSMPDVVAKDWSPNGQELRGIGDVSRVAGQMPTYLARQMWDIKTGGRSGEANSTMLAVATQLEPADILSIAAYLASCDPSAVR